MEFLFFFISLLVYSILNIYSMSTLFKYIACTALFLFLGGIAFVIFAFDIKCIYCRLIFASSEKKFHVLNVNSVLVFSGNKSLVSPVSWRNWCHHS